MSTSTWKERGARGIFLIILLAGLSGVPAAGAAGQDLINRTITPELNVSNYSFNGTGIPGEFAAGPTPVTIFRAEINESTLPGPRYMAFGPSVIGLFIDPGMLAVIFAIVLVCLVTWFVILRKRKTDSGDEDQKEE
jgi:hypothetical protein